jgi:alpha-L-fucosidase
MEGTEIGWSRAGERPHLPVPHLAGSVPVERYDRLYERFDPQSFDAGEWAGLAQAAGARYVVFTTKHHDGFVNFDSALTDYKVTGPQAAFGRDVVAELAGAVRAAGLEMGFYYSQPDWHHPDYFRQHQKYLAYLHGQAEELCRNYGKVALVWFDGLRHSAADWNAEELCAHIRELQPDVLINDRCGLPGDFDTPEQRVGSYQVERPWESCITLGDQWAWRPSDRIKSLHECISMLCQVAGGDGNLLLNVGPRPDGRIEPEQVQRLREMGGWLEAKGESVYATRGGPVLSGRLATTTHRGATVYVHLLQPGLQRVRLAGIDGEVRSAAMLGGSAGEVSFTRDLGDLVLTVSGVTADEVVPVVRLDLDTQVRLRPSPWTSLGRQRAGT